jgi:hypothetical protein
MEYAPQRPRLGQSVKHSAGGKKSMCAELGHQTQAIFGGVGWGETPERDLVLGGGGVGWCQLT